MNFGVQGAAGTFLKWSLQTRWRGGSLPCCILSMARRTSRSPKASGCCRVMSWHPEWDLGPQKASEKLSFTSGALSQSTVCGACFSMALCLQMGREEFYSSFSQLSHQMRRDWSSFMHLLPKILFFKWSYCWVDVRRGNLLLCFCCCLETQVLACIFVYIHTNSGTCTQLYIKHVKRLPVSEKKKWVVCPIWKIPAKREDRG